MSEIPEVWTVGRLLKWTADYFASHKVDTPRLDAEILLTKVLNCSRVDLYTQFDSQPEPAVRAAFRELVKKRASGMPTAYLIGQREFFSLNFKVTPDVLIPRPETEHLVIEVLDILKNKAAKPAVSSDEPVETETDEETGEEFIKPKAKENPLLQTSVKILDIGTGSGIIPICLAKNLPQSQFVAVDISESALEVARENAQTHSVLSQIDFRVSDLFSAIKPDETFDFIVSNPPYIGESELPAIDDSVKNFEPHTALFSGPSGTEIIERLIQQSPVHLNDNSYLIMELSPIIHQSVLSILNNQRELEYVRTVYDLAKLPRLVVCRQKVG